MRRQTSDRKSFLIDRPGGSTVEFILPVALDPSRSGPWCTTLVIPQGSTWTPGPHWHEHYVEYIKVIKGRAKVVLDGHARIVTAEDGPQVVHKHVIHEFMRADVDAMEGEKDQGNVVVQEWTEPSDGFKEVFFRQLGGMLLESSTNPLKVLLVLNHCDNWDVLVPGPLAYYVTHAVYGTAAALARLVGMTAWDPEYIPKRLHAVAKSGGERYRKAKEA